MKIPNEPVVPTSLSRRRTLSSLALLTLAGCAAARPEGDAAALSARGDLLGHRRIGSGPEAVLIMHEWLGDHANWEPVWPYLDATRFCHVFVDLRGYGWSRQMRGAYSADEAVADGLRIMDHFGFGRFHVVGHSMSGMIAQKFIAAAPDRVKSVIAICPVPAAGFRADEKVMAALRAVVEDDGAARKAILARGGARYGETWVDFKLALARRASTREAMHGYLKMFTGTDFAAQVKGSRVPVLAILGKHDIPFYREESVRRNFEPLFPNFSVAVCEEAGHYPMLEAPVFVAGSMERFIRRNASPA